MEESLMEETFNNDKAKKINIFSWLLFLIFGICAGLFLTPVIQYSNEVGNSISFSANQLIFYENGVVTKENQYSKNKIEYLPKADQMKVSLWSDIYESYVITVNLNKGDVSSAKEGLLESYTYGVPSAGEYGYLCIYETNLELYFQLYRGDVYNQKYDYIRAENQLVSYVESPFNLRINKDGKIDVTVPTNDGKEFSFSVEGDPSSYIGSYEVKQGHEIITLDIGNKSFHVSSSNQFLFFMMNTSQAGFVFAGGATLFILIVQLATIKMKKDYKIRSRSLIEGWIALVCCLPLLGSVAVEAITSNGDIFTPIEIGMILILASSVIALFSSIGFLIVTYVNGKPIKKARKSYLVAYRAEKAEERRIENERLAEEKRIENERLAEERRIKNEKLAEEKRIQDEKNKAEKARVALEKQELATAKAEENKKIALENADIKKQKAIDRKQARENKFIWRRVFYVLPLLAIIIHFLFVGKLHYGNAVSLYKIICYLCIVGMAVVSILGTISYKKKLKYYFIYSIFAIVLVSAFTALKLLPYTDYEFRGFMVIIEPILWALLIGTILSYILIKKEKIKSIVITFILGLSYFSSFLMIYLSQPKDYIFGFEYNPYSYSPITYVVIPLICVLLLILDVYALIRPLSKNEVEAMDKQEQKIKEAKERRAKYKEEAKQERILEKEYDSLNKEFNVAIKNKNYEKAKELEVKIKTYEKEHGLENASYFDGGLLQLIGWKVLGNILTVMSFGIAYPWAVCFIKKWEAKHTVINSRRLIFTGTGGGLFVKYIIWWLLSIVTLGIYLFFLPIKMEKWIASHTYDVPLEIVENVEKLKDEVNYAATKHDAAEAERLSKELQEYQASHDIFGESYFDGKLLQLIGWNILAFFMNVFTLGIAVPFSMCLMMKWKMKHQVILGRRLSFNGNGLQLIGRYLLWLLLSVITFGIYAFWLGIKLKKWETKHINYQKSEPISENK